MVKQLVTTRADAGRRVPVQNIRHVVRLRCGHDRVGPDHASALRAADPLRGVRGHAPSSAAAARPRQAFEKNRVRRGGGVPVLPAPGDQG